MAFEKKSLFLLIVVNQSIKNIKGLPSIDELEMQSLIESAILKYQFKKKGWGKNHACRIRNKTQFLI